MGDSIAVKKMQRNATIDIAKGIGILAMVIGHVEAGYLTRMVYSFHMPLFFLISGFLLSEKDDLLTYASKKARQMMMPYFTTAFAWLLYYCARNLMAGKYVSGNSIRNIIIAIFYGSGSGRAALPDGVQLIGAIWFLPALTFGLIYTRFALRRKHPVIWIGGMALASYVSAQFLWLPLSVQAGGLGSLFLYLGYMGKKLTSRVEAERTHVYKKIMCLLGLVAWLTALIIPDLYVVLAANYSKHILVGTIFAVIISCAVLIISEEISRSEFMGSFFCFFGRNSLAVLCFHFLESKIIPWDLIGNSLSAPNELYRILVIFHLKILMISLCIWGASKLPLLKKIYGILC